MRKNKPDFSVYKCLECNDIKFIEYVRANSLRSLKCLKCGTLMKKLFKYAPSRINQFARCEWKTKFKYIDKIEEKNSLHLGEDVMQKGKILHYVFRSFFFIINRIGCRRYYEKGKLKDYFVLALKHIFTLYLKTAPKWINQLSNFAAFQENRYKILLKKYGGGYHSPTFKIFMPVILETWCETATELNFRTIIDCGIIIPAGILDNFNDELCLIDYKTGNPKGSIDKKTGKMKANPYDKRQLVLEAMFWQDYKHPKWLKELQEQFPRIDRVCSLYTGANEKYPNGNVISERIKYNKDGKGSRSYTAAIKWFERMEEAFKLNIFKCKGSEYTCPYCEFDWFCITIRFEKKQKRNDGELTVREQMEALI